MLGRYLLSSAPKGWEIQSTWYTNYVQGLQLDVSDKSQVQYVIGRAQPNLVIHCAAPGAVDWVESHYAEAREAIVSGTENVAKAARDVGASILYVSTNAVFAGDDPPYKEDSPRKPVNAYGQLRMRAEDAVASLSEGWMVVRLMFLYGWPWPGGRSNWAAIICSALQQGRSLALVHDVFWQPTFTGDCAEAIWKLIQNGDDREIYHVAGRDRVTLYDFGIEVAVIFGLETSLLQPVESSIFRSLAKRPKDSTYDLNKINSLEISCRGMMKGLRAMKEERQ